MAFDLGPIREYAEPRGWAADYPRLEAYLEALYETNQRTNLTRVPPEDAVIRHILDSLLVVDFIPQGARVLDIGTGPGFPAWPIAWTRPDVDVLALDSAGKMRHFLDSQALPNLRTSDARAEELGQRDAFDFITGRAVAPFEIQAEISVPWLAVDGMFVPFRTPIEEKDISESVLEKLGAELEDIVHVPLPGTDIVRMFPLVRRVTRCPKEFPRSWSEIRRKPLR